MGFFRKSVSEIEDIMYRLIQEREQISAEREKLNEAVIARERQTNEQLRWAEMAIRNLEAKIRKEGETESLRQQLTDWERKRSDMIRKVLMNDKERSKAVSKIADRIKSIDDSLESWSEAKYKAEARERKKSLKPA